MAHAMPVPGPQHKILEKMAGRWAGPETMMPGPWCPEKQSRQGRTDARMLDNFFLVSDYEQRDGEQVTFRGHGVYSYDPAKQEYVMYWFDSMGGAGGIARGKYEGNTLTFQNTSPMGHHRYRYTFGKGENVFEMAMSSDGKNWQVLMEGRYRPQ